MHAIVDVERKGKEGHVTGAPPQIAGVKDFTREVYEAIYAFPGSTYQELAEMLSVTGKNENSRRAKVNAAVIELRGKQLVNIHHKKTVGFSRPPRIVFAVTEQNPYDPSAGIEVHQRGATRSGKAKHVDPLVLEVDGLRARVAELEAWQADALRRFPDLAVPEIVVRAQRIAANAVREKNPDMAEAILAGQRNDSPIMLATIAALEEAGA